MAIGYGSSRQAQQYDARCPCGNRAIRNSGTKNTSEEVKNSTKRNPAQSKYENDVDAVINGTYNSDSALIMGVTPQIYQKLGFSKLPIAITKNHIYSIAVTEQQAKADGRYNKNVNYHGLGAQAVKDIYENISDPIMVIASPDFQSKTQRESAHKVIAIVDLQVGGKQVIAPIEIDAEVENNNFERIDVNLVSSYFDKSNLNKMLSEAVAQESTGDVGFYYVDKNRAKSIFKKSKVQYLSRLDSLNSNGIIHTIDEKVNRKIDDVLKSKQFIRWFGDWQNKPETASKIVNADGTPKAMYHGTQSSFTAFDKKKAKSYGYYGKGFYFTESESHAQQYGNSMAVYLDVKNPLEQGKNSISKKQLRKFLEAVAENEDYDIWNYGTEDVSEIVDSIYKNDAFAVIQDVNATAIGDFAEAIELYNKVNKTSYDGIVTPTETVVYEPAQIKSVDNIGTFDRNNDDIYFSMKHNVEETKDLIAVHNIREDKFLKTLELGGFPMPSIAVKRAQEAYDDFGDISVVFNKSTIDPKKKSANKVYSGDAWTPTFPRVEYKLNENAQERIKNKIDELVPRNIQDELGRLHLDASNMSDTLNRYDGDMVQAYSGNYTMKYAFLADRGENISIEGIDRNAARKLVDEATDEATYKVWLQGVFGDVIEKEGIRNERDLYTSSGNRRSFEALHYENTLENIIKAMKASGTTGILAAAIFSELRPQNTVLLMK